MKINSGNGNGYVNGITDYSWIQKGYSYGVNDSGPWQRFKRSGLNSSVEQWYNVLFNAGWIVTVTREKVNSQTDQGISTIEANCGWPFPYLYGTETPENIWEIDPEDVQKNLLEADFQFGSVNLTSKLSRTAAANIVEDTGAVWIPPGTYGNTYGLVYGTSNIWNFDNGAMTTADLNTVIAAYVSATGSTGGSYKYVSLPSADYPSVFSLVLLMKAGNEVFPMEASVIRHSMLTSNLYAVKASYNNMGRLISTPSMYSLEGVPTSLLFDVPSYPSASQFIETAGDLQYAWRKVRPAISRLSRMKWRVTQNYQFGLWPVKTFGNTL